MIEELDNKGDEVIVTYRLHLMLPPEPCSLVVRALERYSKDPGSSPGGDACFSHQ